MFDLSKRIDGLNLIQLFQIPPFIFNSFWPWPIEWTRCDLVLFHFMCWELYGVFMSGHQRCQDFPEAIKWPLFVQSGCHGVNSAQVEMASFCLFFHRGQTRHLLPQYFPLFDARRPNWYPESVCHSFIVRKHSCQMSHCFPILLRLMGEQWCGKLAFLSAGKKVKKVSGI